MTAADPPSTPPAAEVHRAAQLLVGDGWWLTHADPATGTRSVRMSDGPTGLRREHGDTTLPATCFPPAVTLAASWDAALIEEVGRALGHEARALGVDVLLAPGVNLKRTPLCGRHFEYIAEDPLVSGVLGAAYVRGVQSTGVGASLKHYAANNQEHERHSISADIDERTLRELYLSAFEYIVRDADPWTVMCAYNRLNGVYASQNRWLLTEVLRDEWGYPGLVVSDWGAVHDPVAAVAAGLDLQMPGDHPEAAARIAAAVNAGELSADAVERAADRVRALAARCGEAKETIGVDDAMAEAHDALARRAAAAGTVLLSNDGTLPLVGPRPVELVETPPLVEPVETPPLVEPVVSASSTPRTPAPTSSTTRTPAPTSSTTRTPVLALIGRQASEPVMQGGGSSHVVPLRNSSLLDALRQAVPHAEVRYADGYDYEQVIEGRPLHRDPDDPRAAALRARAVATAASADVVVLCVGHPLMVECEGYDRLDLDLPADQVALIEALVGGPSPVVVVLTTGAPLALGDWRHRASAVLLPHLGGQAGGAALADVLLGVAEPGGRLTETWPFRLTDTPAAATHPGERGHVRYGEGVFVGYRWYDALERSVAYPFGHGLGYTTFSISGITADVMHAEEGRVRAEVTLTNTGDRAGSTVVQLYVGEQRPMVRRPPRELRAFGRVLLAAGETSTVPFELDAAAWAFWDVVSHCWQRNPGTFTLAAGLSSRDLHAMTEVTLPGDSTAPPLLDEATLAERLQGR